MVFIIKLFVIKNYLERMEATATLQCKRGKNPNIINDSIYIYSVHNINMYSMGISGTNLRK